MARGKLRVYLGAAPGVGKTVAMLSEARRRKERGTDVVIGVCETHGRSYTAALMEGLEQLPLREVTHRGAVLRELDIDALLARRPEVALVDELAHTNAPGSRHTKRWEDVHDLLDAGISVISTVNIQHLESLNDVVEAITGVRQQETVPDEVVREADQIELVDMSPHALRRRLAHGNVYAAEKVDAALANYFREGNLSALRELSLCGWPTASRRVSTATGPTTRSPSPWPTRERVVVALTGGPEGRTLLRRAAQIASRGAGESCSRSTSRHPTASWTPVSRASGAAPAHCGARRHLPHRQGGKTLPRRCSTSPGASTPARSSSAPRGGPAGGHFSRRAWASASWTARAISTSTS